MAEQKFRVCDLCELNGSSAPLEERVAVETLSIRFESGGKITLDLCATDLTALLTAIPLKKLQKRKSENNSSTAEHTCPVCDKAYKSRNGLAYHMQSAHGDPEEAKRIAGVKPTAKGPHICPTCGKECANVQGLKAHMRSHISTDGELKGRVTGLA